MKARTWLSQQCPECRIQAALPGPSIPACPSAQSASLCKEAGASYETSSPRLPLPSSSRLTRTSSGPCGPHHESERGPSVRGIHAGWQQSWVRGSGEELGTPSGSQWSPARKPSLEAVASETISKVLIMHQPQRGKKKILKEENKDLMGLRDSHTIGKGCFCLQLQSAGRWGPGGGKKDVLASKSSTPFKGRAACNDKPVPP